MRIPLRRRYPNLAIDWDGGQPSIFTEHSRRLIAEIRQLLEEGPARSDFDQSIACFEEEERILLQEYRASGGSGSGEVRYVGSERSPLQKLDEMAIALSHHLRRSHPQRRDADHRMPARQIIIGILILIAFMILLYLISQGPR